MDRSLAVLLERFQSYQLLEPEQLDEFLRGDPDRWAGPEALAEELVRRGWITPYQVERILDGRGQDLVLGPYLLLRPLAQGGMGQVYMARQRFLGRVVALKVIHQQSRDPKSVERFLREMRAFARLSHPNIVTAYDADEVDDTLFLVMEYVEGVTLADLVAEGVPPGGGAGQRLHPPGRPGPAARPREGHGPSRHQAVEPAPGPQGRGGQDPRPGPGPPRSRGEARRDRAAA